MLSISCCVLHTPCACTYDNLLASQDVFIAIYISCQLDRSRSPTMPCILLVVIFRISIVLPHSSIFSRSLVATQADCWYRLFAHARNIMYRTLTFTDRRLSNREAVHPIPCGNAHISHVTNIRHVQARAYRAYIIIHSVT